MQIQHKYAKLPDTYHTYIFDLYGTLVDIHTDEHDLTVWKKFALFWGYYKAHYEPEALKASYRDLIQIKEQCLKSILENLLHMKCRLLISKNILMIFLFHPHQ